MSEKKKNICIMIFAAVACIGLLLILTKPFSPKKEETSGSGELGSFDYTAPAEEYEDLTDQYDPSKEPGSELDANNTFVTNYEVLYNFLPINAAGSMSVYAAEFLNEHGYGGYHELTVLENTISSDETYPRFICAIDDTDKYVEVRYRTDTKEFSFAMIDQIY